MIKVFKQIVCLVLVAVVLLQTFGTTIVLTDYQINKDYIAKVLCVNKSKPKMHCNGKCHLKKELNKAEKKQQSPTNSVKEKGEIQLYAQFNSTFNLLGSVIENHNNVLTYYSFHLSDKHLNSIFHPPQA